MSRTKRKCKWYHGNNDTIYIENEIKKEYMRKIRFGFEWVSKSKEEYETELSEAKKAYDINMKIYIENEKKFVDFYVRRFGEHPSNNPSNANFYKSILYNNNKKPYLYVNKKKLIPFNKSYEEFRQDYDVNGKFRYFLKRHRDGYDSESKRSKGFRKDCVKQIRNSNRRNVNTIMKDLDCNEEIVWSDRKDGKSKIWDWF